MLQLIHYTVTNILYTCAVDMTRSSFDIILKVGWCPVEYVIAVLACHVVISNYIVLLK
jgi:hypothetical protein